MTKVAVPIACVAGSTDAIEAAFYEALQRADVDKLMACWADENDVVCVHPGGPRLIGVGAIRAAFDALFVNSSIRAWPEAVHKTQSPVSVVHSVRERIDRTACLPMGWCDSQP